MKTRILLSGLAVVACIASTSILAQSNTVYSQNMVGNIKVDLPSNQFYFLSLNLNNVGGTNQAFGPMLGDQLPTLSQAYFWNSSSQVWYQAQKKAVAKGGWGVDSNRVVSVGEGVFIKASSNMTVYLMGEVPMAPTTTVVVINGLNAMGYSYPVTTAWTNTALSQGLPTLSSLYVWNAIAGWVNYQKKAPAKGGWGAATNLVINPGDAFFVQSSVATNVFDVRPFNP